MTAWNVSLNRKAIDTVFTQNNMSAEEVKHGLVNHDGYDPAITVRKARGEQQQFFFEVTDTFGGEANYSWVNRYLVTATTLRGAVLKVAREQGFSGRIRKDFDSGDMVRWNVQGAAICIFGSWSDGGEAEQYNHVKKL